ncbi:hypothetical protein HZH68_011763 [Vespula germanica]|uniref:Uncharacterized protein n=1 Tax=Vespula germanica TaxID=30212 RepID=A0A834JLW1_VESGE|nr:hypothetical protein HZH68_011763 [Vespula germanica]
MGLVHNIERWYIALSIIVLRTCVYLELCCIRSGSSSIVLKQPGAHENYIIALSVTLQIRITFASPFQELEQARELDEQVAVPPPAAPAPVPVPVPVPVPATAIAATAAAGEIVAAREQQQRQ